jgi:hypothetical protein
MVATAVADMAVTAMVAAKATTRRYRWLRGGTRRRHVTLVPSVVEASVVAIATATVEVAACPGMKVKRKRQVVPMEAMMNLVALVAAAAARPRFQNTNKYLQKLIFLWRVYFVLDLTKVIYFNRQGNSAPLGLQRSIQQYRGSSSRAISSRRFST